MNGLGAGYVALDWLLCIGALLAVVLQFAVLRSPDVPESPLLDGTRKARVIAWGLLFCRTLYVLAHDGDLAVPVQSLIPLLMLVWSDVISAVARLFADGGHPALQSGTVPLDGGRQ